jgi:hypothetical protein
VRANDNPYNSSDRCFSQSKSLLDERTKQSKENDCLSVDVRLISGGNGNAPKPPRKAYAK